MGALTTDQPIGHRSCRALGLASDLFVWVLLQFALLTVAHAMSYQDSGPTLTASGASRHDGPSLQVAFSPRGQAEALVIEVIASARVELAVLAYSFTSASITEALLQARKRGVRVRLVVDRLNNLVDDRSGKARAALQALAHAGVEVRVCDAYAIHHDKVIVADRRPVQTVSFNDSSSAQTRNSENVLVLWNSPDLVVEYLQHFERNRNRALVLDGRY